MMALCQQAAYRFNEEFNIQEYEMISSAFMVSACRSKDLLLSIALILYLAMKYGHLYFDQLMKQICSEISINDHVNH